MKKTAAILFLSLIINSALFAQKQMAITIDDPNTYSTPGLAWQERDDKILATLNKHGIKSALFVCGMRVNDDNGAALLRKWDAENHLICNHSFSHFYYHSAAVSSDSFCQDFRRGDSLIIKYKNYTKLFRFPYLKEGNTVAKRDAMREVMLKEGYKNGHVTIDASDWYVNSKITEALRDDPNADLEPYKQYYIRHILDRANYYDSLAVLLYKKEVSHTLLIHHSLLNALFLDDLLTTLKTKEWNLIDAKQAFSDDIFDMQPVIEPCGESLVWQCAQLDNRLSAQLRYPAEDSRYEKEPLEKFIQEYKASRSKSRN
jgi:peptidoglycan-N-acetylglucosamine deacetylase